MTWIRLESERRPAPALAEHDRPIIDAEYTVVNEPPNSRWRRQRASEPNPASMLEPLWAFRVILCVLLWPIRYLVRMAVVTLALVMILVRPFILFFYAASFVAFCGMGIKLYAGQLELAGQLAFWSVALGAIPAIWDYILEIVAPDMEWKRLQM
ncbi:hypothetical protein [Methylobacterium isbiliense]|uniref:Uncharacterized protein n=1 Tax=Methylobacterium isbiliense TaxID=315478 RepID=A0ABQ4SRV2_9HYPH|nr:hypothetical protein [Methylobacterium isbiliense]MDN3627670.1 hypothetical protein [Methylobacterium isbiliense]GJE04524.1 hypothetical protein GMJLKIPL_6488 [Methylobacterium isbiliense]